MQKATFAAGCFWGIEDAFSKLDGVIHTLSGYTGGHVKYPKYKDVIRGRTGHVEAVQVTFDPSVISYRRLLDEFWKLHDSEYAGCIAVSLDGKGPVMGDHYRSMIFYHNEEQKRIAIESKKEQEDAGDEVTTEIVPAEEFYPAEEYHQQFFKKNKQDM
ncbi:peptide methionine sulfoxide reductase [Methanosalsum zhilinae DSM 4017]|uniref:Peptide methionine sulfoxide reductase MsrA n=1 Tax=Methanosalsum zhilinae (strain DSM 4017 / NBRC 107636 / OCM 62 / WeN5) TaxID=679901 RepID=F7XP23_METZD|nr:peptide-methionine (S)-S-oxide reductase MsrA [Methanosalsum zhilinae]AEH60218.1 peptide methionine sulfoxide reductase [Methanosalsum zhilinae DSM 4017]